MVRLRRLSLVAAALSSSASATFAQASAPDAQQLQRVEVTGSRIKRLESETPAPVQVITREQIEKSGAASVAEVLKTLPAGNYGGFDENAVSSFSPGAASVSLRGMGTQATLVLVNGRRVAPYGFASNGQSTFVDLNSIPLEAVERIDVLLDGASALYGSDAMAGVINIILRKDFSGFQVRGGFGQSSYGDATSKQGALTFGKGSLATDGYNFIVNFEHHEQKPVKASERPLTASSDFSAVAGPFADFRSSYAYPGNLYTVGGTSGEGTTLLGPLAGCTPVADGSVLSGGCVYDGVKYKDVVSDTSRDLFVLSSTFALGGGAQLFGDLMLGRSRFLQASYSFGTDRYYGLIPTSAITLPVGHLQNPYGTDVALRTTFADVPNTLNVVSDTRRLVFGARATLAGWDAESALLHSRSKTTIDTRGFLRDSVLLNEVLDPGNGYAAQPGFIFGNPAANDPALMARLYPTLRDNGNTSITSIDLRGNRDLMAMAGGPMSLAVGAELRREAFQTRPDPLVAAFEISGLGSSSADGSRKVSAIYSELSVPVFKGLETQFALRTDHYSDFGTATTPKLGLKWKALPQLALRATYSRGFRAPSLPELVSTASTGFYPGLTDPLLCPNPPDPGNPNCLIPYVQAELGGNPGLMPEKSKSFTAGVVFEPVRNLSVAFDAYRIKRIDEITFLDPSFLLANEALYPGYVQRDPGTQELTLLKLPYTNLGTTRLWGYDIDVKARVPLAELGALNFEATYNRQPRYVVQPVPGAPEQDWAGAYLTPKERFMLGAGWDRGPWSSKLVWNYVGGYSRALSSTDSVCPYAGSAYEAMCSVKSWSTTDLYLSYSGFKNLQLSVSVRNIENKQAPIDERNLAYFTAFNSALHNQLGRYVTLNAKYTFW